MIGSLVQVCIDLKANIEGFSRRGYSFSFEPVGAMVTELDNYGSKTGRNLKGC